MQVMKFVGSTFFLLAVTVVVVGCHREPVSTEPAEPAAPRQRLITIPEGPGVLQHAMSQAFLAKGGALLESGAYGAAIQSLSDALVADPGNASIYYLRAAANLRRHRLAEAIEDLSAAIGALPQPDYYLSRCGAYFMEGEWDSAISDCTDTIQLAPMNTDAYFLRALNYFSKGDIERSLADALAVLVIHPKDANARHLIDEVLAERERRERGYTTTPMIKTGNDTGQ